MMRALAALALFTASSVSARCLSSLVPLALSAVNFDLDDPSWNTTYPVAGVFTVELEYCAPTNAVSAHTDTLLLSLPGGTYGPLYWDFPFQPENYSFVRHANARGFATLNVARIGSGRSDHPDPLKILQTPLQISAALELIARARAGAWGGRRYGKIVGLGHSLSSYILNGAIVQDPDALAGIVLTGFAHTISGQPDVSAFPQANSVGLERFATLPSGYVTTPSGARSGGLYGLPGTFDDAVVEFDDAHRDLHL